MSLDEELQIVPREAPDRVIFELSGELDMAGSARLTEAVSEAEFGETSTVVLDLRRVSFLDSTGLKAIFTIRNVVREHGRQFAVTPGSAQVQRLLKLTRLDEHLQMIDSPDALLA
jgi:anti-sigma B factor antagonist